MTDSHIGGPLLWPADEPWPWCDGSKHDEGLTILPADSFGVRVALVGAVQLFQRDFPELPFPPGTDLHQVLLCPLEHWDEECPSCGADRRFLLALYTHEEPEKELCSCEVAERAVVGWEFGREGALNVFACTQDVQHPIKLHID